MTWRATYGRPWTEDITAAFREELAGKVSLDGDLALENIITSKDGTRKVTYRLKNGGGIVESVIIPSNMPDGRTTVCVSSQLGRGLHSSPSQLNLSRF